MTTTIGDMWKEELWGKLQDVTVVFIEFAWADGCVQVSRSMIWHVPVYGLQKIEWDTDGEEKDGGVWEPPVKYMGFMR